MKEEEKDILGEAVNRIKSEAIPPGPSKDLTDATVTRLEQSMQEIPAADHQHSGFVERLLTTHSLPILTFRFALAAVLVLFVGFAAGRLSGPKPPDMEQLYAELEPAIKASVEKTLYEKVSDEIDQRWRLALEKTCFALKDELTRQYRADLSQFATQMLVASNAETNRLLGNLAQSLDEAKTQDMRRIAEAFYQLDQERCQDKSLFTEYIRSLANQTDSELERTRQQMFKLISNTSTPGPGDTEDQDTLDNHKE